MSPSPSPARRPLPRAMAAWALAVLLAGAGTPQAAGGAPALPLPPAAQAQLDAGRPARLLVELAAPAAPHGTAAARAALGAAQARVLAALPAAARGRVRSYDRLPFLAGRFDADEAARLRAHPDVVAIHEDRRFAPVLAETVPLVGADTLHASGIEGAGAAVAVLDTGVDAGHPMLQGAVVAEACFSADRDCPNGRTSQIGPGAGAYCTYAEGCFHGTHVAGIAVGRPAARTGVAPAADLVAVQVFSKANGVACNGTGENPCALAWTSDIVAGMDHVLTLAASVDVAAVNLSLGGGSWSSEAVCDADNGPLETAADALDAAGVATVASSGNAGQVGAMGSPACVSSVVAVGASQDDDTVWSGSNEASFLDLLAPGRNVVSAVPPGLVGVSYGSATGTSMAAPHVSGAFALLRSVAPGIAPSQALEALRATGVPILDGRSGRTYPRLAVADAASALMGPECANFLDDDGDGLVDHPDDPGCYDVTGIEAPACDDDVDNDGDGAVDWDGGPGGAAPDPQCDAPSGPREGSGTCGLGFEVAPLLAALAVLRRRRAVRRRA